MRDSERVVGGDSYMGRTIQCIKTSLSRLTHAHRWPARSVYQTVVADQGRAVLDWAPVDIVIDRPLGRCVLTAVRWSSD